MEKYKINILCRSSQTLVNHCTYLSRTCFINFVVRKRFHFIKPPTKLRVFISIKRNYGRERWNLSWQLRTNLQLLIGCRQTIRSFAKIFPQNRSLESHPLYFLQEFLSFLWSIWKTDRIRNKLIKNNRVLFTIYGLSNGVFTASICRHIDD